MTAFTRLADGTTVRWHATDLSECAVDTCNLRHVDRSELFDPIAFTAGAMCAASEPHGVVGDDWPCPSCLARVRTASAPASNPSASGLPASPGAGFDGGSDRAPVPPSGQVGTSTTNSNRPGTLNPRAAESGPVRPQEQSMP